MKTIIPVIVLLFLIPIAAYGSEEILLYEGYGVSIEYPAVWNVIDDWDSDPGAVFIKSDTSDTSARYDISIMLADEYTLASEHKKIKIDNVELIDEITHDMEEACRDNSLGSCWNYELLDSKIVTVSGQQAISVKYRDVFEDEKAIVRVLLLPDGEKFWQVEARLIGEDDRFDLLEASIDSFQLVRPDNTKLILEHHADPDIEVHRVYDVNLILVGSDWSNQVKSSVQNRLLSYTPYVDPINSQTYERVGIRHSYNYNFESITGSQVDELAEFMRENSESVPLFGSEYDYPVWQASWVAKHHQDREPKWLELDTKTGDPVFLVDYRIIDALAVEEYIQEKLVGSNPDLSGPQSVNLVFLSMDFDQADFLRNYFIRSSDDATDKVFKSVGLRGYGGNYNMMFFDMYAAPWIHFEQDTGEHYFPDLNVGDHYFPHWIESMHDCDTEECMAFMIDFTTESALRYVISPSLQYDIHGADKYVVDVLVYTKPGQSSTITPATLKYFVNEEKLIREFEYLYPYADWEVRFTLEKHDDRGLTQEFKQSLTETRIEHLDILDEEKRIHLLDTDEILPHLISWAAETDDTDSETVTIPVLVEVSSIDTDELYLDEYGVIGVAANMPDSNEPCCALIVTKQKHTWEEKIGLTDLLLHEVGHVLGLMHSSTTITNSTYAFPTINRYFDWYSSPMTYSGPDSGCGILHSLLYDDQCGNASLSFTEFERNIISDARLASLWKQTDSNLKALGTDGSQVLAMLSDSKAAYQRGDLYSPKGSLVLAQDAYKASLAEPLGTAPRVPDWVKNNAKWWADGSIDDDSFIQGIGFLINNDVISVSKTVDADAEASGSKVPSWVKSNAGWWADGSITEDEFLRGIEFLVATGVIRID